MVDLSGLESNQKYKFTIEQSGESYEAIIIIEAPLSSTTDSVVGTVKKSDYPIEGGWEGKQFRINLDGTVEVPGDPFGPVGEVKEYHVVN